MDKREQIEKLLEKIMENLVDEKEPLSFFGVLCSKSNGGSYQNLYYFTNPLEVNSLLDMSMIDMELTIK